MGGPPKCWEFSGPPADGTTVSAFPAGVCEGSWTIDLETLIGGLLQNQPELFAVVSFPSLEPLYANEPGFPMLVHPILVEHAFSPQDRQGVVLGVREGSVVSMNTICSGPPEIELERRDQYEVILRGPAYQ